MTVPPHDPEDESGSHRAERPVPRSGLSEERSATHLTPDSGTHQSDPYTTITPADDTDDDDARYRAADRSTTDGRDDEDAHGSTAYDDADRRRDDAVLEGASDEAPRSRGASHVWGLLATLLLIPVAWYLIADAGARLALPADGPWQSGTLNIAALLELGGGLLALVVALLAARWTSLGAIVTGVLVLLLGLPFVAFPARTQEYLQPVTDWLRDFNDMGANIAHHLEASGSTGRLVAYGVALILVGVVSHGARRQGRREERAATRRERRRSAGVS